MALYSCRRSTLVGAGEPASQDFLRCPLLGLSFAAARFALRVRELSVFDRWPGRTVGRTKVDGVWLGTPPERLVPPYTGSIYLVRFHPHERSSGGGVLAAAVRSALYRAMIASTSIGSSLIFRFDLRPMTGTFRFDLWSTINTVSRSDGIWIV